MGYSCTAAADDMLREIQAMFPSKSNFWKDDAGIEYFLEGGRENRDGAITGTVFRMDGYKVGSVRIEPNGFVTRFPHLPKRIRVHIQKMNKNLKHPAMFQVI